MGLSFYVCSGCGNLIDGQPDRLDGRNWHPNCLQAHLAGVKGGQGRSAGDVYGLGVIGLVLILLAVAGAVFAVTTLVL